MSIEAKLLLYFKENVHEAVTPSTLLVEESIIDSMGVMDLIEFIETEFSVSLDTDDLTVDNFSSIGTITKLVTEKLGA